MSANVHSAGERQPPAPRCVSVRSSIDCASGVRDYREHAATVCVARAGGGDGMAHRAELTPTLGSPAPARPGAFIVGEVGMGHAGSSAGGVTAGTPRTGTDCWSLCADRHVNSRRGRGLSPSDFNDRLLLGLKGTMSEAELQHSEPGAPGRTEDTAAGRHMTRRVTWA